MPPAYFPLRWESTGDQWWYASPIDWAAANGHYDLVRELLHLDTNLLIKLTSLRRIRRLETVWDDELQFDDVAVCRSQVARQLLRECETERGHNTLIRAGYGGWLLYTAASAGDMDFVKELLERDPLLVYGEGEYGVTDIFYAAARSKNSEVFRLLLDFGSIRGELEGQSEDILSLFRWEMMNRAVHAAARGGNVEILRELLVGCSDVLTYRDAQGSTLLHTASGRGRVEVVKDLVASYDINDAADNQGNTALHVAANRGYLAAAEVLISASPSSAALTNNYGDTFFHMAVAGFKSPGFHRLDRQIDLVKQLVSGKIVDLQDIINARNHDGRTALHMAVIENIHSDLVELLMTVPSINLNIRDSNGMTPLDLLKQRPQSASSEILIKRLISAGGISNSRDHMTRSAIVSHLKLQGIGGSPGTSFRIPDAEIFLYTGVENASDASCDLASAGYNPYSGELSECDSATCSNSLDNKKLGSVNYAAKRLKILLGWRRKKERKEDSSKAEEDDSVESFRMYGGLEDNPTPLRIRYSKQSALPNNKRVSSLRSNLPSPLAKKKFAAKLMHGVLQVFPQSSVETPPSPLSESSRSSSLSTRKCQGAELGDSGNSVAGTSGGEKLKRSRKQASLNTKLMNQYFCFGTHGLAVEHSINQVHERPSFKHPSNIMA